MIDKRKQLKEGADGSIWSSNKACKLEHAS